MLERLWEREGIPQRELAELLFKDRPTITRMLIKLDARGLVRCQPDGHDRRILHVYLTAAERDLQAPVLTALKGFRARAYGSIGEEGQILLMHTLDRLFDGLD